MRKFTALLLAAALGLGSIAGCGSEEKQTATEFCADHGGVRPNTTEPDGDALCEDGTEYEAESESSSKKKKSKKKRK
jgi:hypothetical protein